MMCRTWSRPQKGVEGNKIGGEGLVSSMMYPKEEMASSKSHRIYALCTFIF